MKEMNAAPLGVAGPCFLGRTEAEDCVFSESGPSLTRVSAKAEGHERESRSLPFSSPETAEGVKKWVGLLELTLNLRPLESWFLSSRAVVFGAP